MAKTSIAESWVSAGDELHNGTSAIVQCGDCLCFAIKNADGIWRDKQLQALKVDAVETVLDSNSDYLTQERHRIAGRKTD
jgi:hypothetical protein